MILILVFVLVLALAAVGLYALLGGGAVAGVVAVAAFGVVLWCAL